MTTLVQSVARWGATLIALGLAFACSDSGPLPNTGGAGGSFAGSMSGAAAGSVAAGSPGDGGTTGAAGATGDGGAMSGGGSVSGGAGTGGATSGSAGSAAAGGGGANSGGDAGSGGGSALRGKASLVIRGSGTPTAGDQVMIGRLEAFGYQEIVTLTDADADADAVMGSDLVVISSSAESGPLKDRLKDVPIPVLCIEDAEFKLMGMASAGGHDDGVSQLVVKEGGSQLVGNLMGTVAISSQAGELGWGTPAATAMIGATMPNDPTRAVVFGYPAGAQMSTMVAPARRAGFAIREQLAANLNADGIAVFDSLLAWVAQD